MTVRSTPDCKRCMAVVCRRVCGEICLPFKVGHRLAATPTAAWSLFSTPERDNGPPLRLGKKKASGAGLSLAAQSRNCSAVLFHSGTVRCLRPLPVSWTLREHLGIMEHLIEHGCPPAG